MTLEWEQVIVDARDPLALGRWWAQALGWVFVGDDPDEVEIRPAPDTMPGLLFAPVTEPKTVKNRLHLDVNPAPGAPTSRSMWTAHDVSREPAAPRRSRASAARPRRRR